MLTRREVIKGTVGGLLAGSLASEATGEEVPTVFGGATARFNKANQERLPLWAFEDDLPTPLTIRPHRVATYGDLLDVPAFGPADLIPIGNVFHGTAREWAETPEAWRSIGCQPTEVGAMRGEGWTERAKAAWEDKRKHFGDVLHFCSCPVGVPEKAVYKDANDSPPPNAKRVSNWGHFPIKCYKVPVVELEKRLRREPQFPARLYGYAGMVPGPLFKFRHGQPALVRYENHLETEISVHLHGGHTPSHSDGFPSFYVLQGKSRDYFYPNILPLKKKGDGVAPEIEESLSTMWYHDHGMDGTAFNVSKGLAGMAMFYTDWELKLIRDGVLPGLGIHSCLDPDETVPADAAEAEKRRKDLEHPEHPGFYAPGKEPFYNPYDLPLVLQDKVIDLATGQVAYDGDAHNGYLGDTFFVNGVAWPRKQVAPMPYRLRMLNGSNSRIYRMRILSEADFFRSQRVGLSAAELEKAAKPFLQIGKDSCLWSEAGRKTSVVLAMANRADLIVDFQKLSAAGGGQVFYLVNTMPQFDGRGPKAKLDDGGDPRVLPLPFDTDGTPLVELDKPIAMLRFIVNQKPAKIPEGPTPQNCPPETTTAVPATAATRPATMPDEMIGVLLAPKRERIPAEHVKVVREFIFERGKAAWQINGEFYDPTKSHACPTLSMLDDSAEEWVLRNGGGGWWHPIHIHLESHQLISYEKDFEADAIIDPPDGTARRRPRRRVDVTGSFPKPDVIGNHDTQILGPNTVARIRMRFRTWPGPFVFHCHNLEHEDMRMMNNFEPVHGDGHDPNVAPAARTHGNQVTLNGKSEKYEAGRVGELPWEQPPVPGTPANEAGENLIEPRRNKDTTDG